MPSTPEASAVAQPRATVLGAFLEGWRRVIRAPALAAGILAATFVTALPLTVVLGQLLEANLGPSLESERALGGWDPTWAGEFAAGADGVGKTFTHEILGFGGALAALSRFLDHQALNPAVAGTVAAYVALWIFLSGGVLDRMARGRPVRAFAFFAACGDYFLRFLRLAVVMGACYWALFRWLHPLLFDTIYNRWTRDLTEEHTALVLRVSLYLAFGLALMLVSLVADFAKVRAVVEDRRSMIGALGASARFVRRRLIRVSALYVLNIVAVVVVARVWLQTAPSASASTWLALFAGQVYILGRVWAKLAFMASEVAFFQGELAHAPYTAAPEPVWPDSPAVEAIRNLRG